MELSQKQYNDLARYAKSLMGIEAEDSVNDAYIALMEDGATITFEVLKAKIKSIVLHEKYNAPNHKKDDFYMKMTEKVCSMCKENLPIGMYRLYTRQAKQRREFCGYCKNCENKYKSEYEKKNRVKISERQKKKRETKKPVYRKDVEGKRFTEWHKDNKEKWNAYMRERYKLMGRKDRLPK